MRSECQCRPGLPADCAVRRWFDKIVLCVIIANCVTLAMFDPLQEECELQCTLLELAERGFSVFFLAEMVSGIV